MFRYIALALGALKLASAATVLTGQYTCDTAGDYTLCNDQWGIANGVGSQTSTLISASGNTISWSTNYTWANNENDVKTYANVLSNTAKGVQIAKITSFPTAWTWTYETESSALRADVSYDMWTGTAETGTAASSSSSYEIMIWLSGKGGIQPVGSLKTSGISLAGHTWNLWSGTTETWTTLSFVSASGDITNFNTDLTPFFQYLVDNEGVSSSQYIQAIQTGTEAFTGTANLVTSSFSVSLA
ncbi:endo-1,4-beta-glucanase precursor [Heliocybe sulcata]|uniref:Endo-1,4-beta-glucanase n=1 Tax=Heliocybe sulcata TaxID=5364 RepID=A0A5C3N0B4_9AGAM|nr:endo-1,4-beta-glucanase precursor [Heliocybe sulcata]